MMIRKLSAIILSFALAISCLLSDNAVYWAAGMVISYLAAVLAGLKARKQRI